MIGLFDSGIGGLGIFQALRRMAPAADLVYLADSAGCPYGPRPVEEVQAISRAHTERLAKMGAKVVVVACNSATVAAIAHLRERYPELRFVGTVPAVKPAALEALRAGGRVVMLSTKMTAASEAYARLKAMFTEGVEVHDVPCPGLAEAIEHEGPRSLMAERLLREALADYVPRTGDHVVLGCTHYTLMRETIAQELGAEVSLIDTDAPVARQTLRLAEPLGAHEGDGGERLLTTAAPEAVSQIVPSILGRRIEAEALS